MKYCPFCSKPHHNDPKNLNCLNMSKENGVYLCFRCGSQGSWLNFRERILGFKTDMYEHLESGGGDDKGQARLSEVEYFIYKSNLEKEEFREVVEYLK